MTGGYGFIGSHVVRALLGAGSSVLVIDREAAGNAAEEVLDERERREAPLVSPSIPGVRSLTRLLRERHVEAIIHLASPLATVTERQPSTAVDGMIVPHRVILDAARLAGIRKVVWASSVGVFGRSEDYLSLPIPNDAPHHPLTLYGAAKSFLERLSSGFTDRYGLDTLGLRFPLVYGPGRRRGGGQFTTRLIEGAARGEPQVVADADGRHDWMFATDAARSVELALSAARTPSRALTVGGEVASVHDVVDLLRRRFPESEMTVLPGVSALVADYDPSPALTEIGYRSSVSLRDGVLATANAARRRAGLAEVG